MYLLRVLIGWFCCLSLLWLPREITLVLVLRHSIENRSNIIICVVPEVFIVFEWSYWIRVNSFKGLFRLLDCFLRHFRSATLNMRSTFDMATVAVIPSAIWRSCTIGWLQNSWVVGLPINPVTSSVSGFLSGSVSQESGLLNMSKT